MSLTYFIEKYFIKNYRITITRVLELQFHFYKFYSKIVNTLVLEKKFKKFNQNLFINIDDSNGQSNHTYVI